MIGRPRARLLVLGDAIGVFAGMAQRALVEVARPAAADIQQYQPQRPADCRVGAVARAEGVAVAVHADRTGNRAVDDQQGCGHVGRRLDPVQIERLGRQRQHRRAHHRRIFGLAPGHDHIDRQHLARQVAVARRHLAFDKIRFATECRDKLVDPLAGRRHDRQPVGPALCEIPFDEIGPGRHWRYAGCGAFCDFCGGCRHASAPAADRRANDITFATISPPSNRGRSTGGSAAASGAPAGYVRRAGRRPRGRAPHGAAEAGCGDRGTAGPRPPV